MNPGRELDALIAEKVMGWKWLSRNDLNRDSSHPGFSPWSKRLYPPGYELEYHCTARGEPEFQSDIPPYSTDMAAAWKVASETLATGDFEIISIHKISPIWCVAFSPPYARAYGDTAPHAICLAALEALKMR